MPRSPNPPHRDPDHRHSAWLTRQTTSVRQQFVEADIPAYFAYARKFTLCDQYFTDIAGPSTPNHLMVLAADSPFIDNPHPGDPSRIASSLPLSLESQKADLGKLWWLRVSISERGWREKQVHVRSVREGRRVGKATQWFLGLRDESIRRTSS